jgi:tetratricopeptide (TPR) repeat protein
MFRIFIVSCLLFCSSSVAMAEDIGPLPKSLETATDNAASGLSRKKTGDQYAAQGDYRKAAEAYEHALSLARETFSVEERTGMAVTMSWGGKKEEAVRELRLVLAQDPGNNKTRIHLARSLSWIGRTDEAVAEADKVLSESPDDTDALLAKANALRYKRDNDNAIPLYRKVLEKEDNFQARIGLAYIDLSRGDFSAAREGSRRLRPQYPYQENERKELDAAIAKATRPAVSPKYTYYRDTDENRVNRYSVSTGLSAKNWKFELGYRHTDARDLTRHAKADDLSLSAYSRISRYFGIGAGIGGTRLSDGDTRNFPVGHVRADASVFGGTIGVAASRTVFADTAQLIENDIRFTSITTSISHPLPYRLSLDASHSYKDYSDDNSSNDVQGSLKYTFRLKTPSIGAGYRIRHLDFERESRSGYFDPSDFLAHQGFITLYYQKGAVHTYLEPFYGHQSFKRTGADTNDWFWGGNGVIGIRIPKNVLLEIHGEGGDYAVGTATGFQYYLVGLRVNIIF